MTTELTSPFPPSSFAKARLLSKPVYREEADLWEAVVSNQDDIRAYFTQIGLELVCDPGEGFAFLRQIQPEDDTIKVPRLLRRSALSYEATVLLVCLRGEFLRFDASPDDSSRLVRKREDLRELVGAFFRETNNQVKDIRSVDRAIDRLCELGFLSEMKNDEFEIMRIVKARIGPSELETIRDRLTHHIDDHV